MVYPTSITIYSSNQDEICVFLTKNTFLNFISQLWNVVKRDEYFNFISLLCFFLST